ncbi:MAG: nucleoside triphosphate pyrophosphohydrolase, partial [Actinomycetota bacterium]
MAATITVVGLGPGGAEHVTTETLTSIERVERRHLRTAIHPSAHLVLDAPGGAIAHDDLYESSDTFDDVYRTICDRLVADATEHGEVLYAVPGSPLVLERTVQHLRGRAAAGEVELDVLPAMSFLDVAWARLGIDPVESGVRLIDGHEFVPAAAGEAGPLLVAHTHADWVLSEIKLAVDEVGDDTTGGERAVILQALGTDDEQVVETTWSELDRTITADHLTSIYIPKLAAPVGAEYVRFHQLTRVLREQCPWDVEQTHQTLIPYLLEETYEVVDALQALDADDPTTDDDLVEELGDLLYQIEFHATIAEQEGRFTIADVARGVHDKLVRRHPHVFQPDEGVTVDAETTAEVLSNWEAIKQVEKQRTSIFDGIPRSMPALSYAAKVGRKASKVGFDWPDVSGAFPKLSEETGELDEAIRSGDSDEIGGELGDLLFATVNVARHVGVDPELALRSATDKFRRRFEGVEALARARDISLANADLATLDGL